jgi:hypothetical protein
MVFVRARASKCVCVRANECVHLLTRLHTNKQATIQAKETYYTGKRDLQYR